MFEDLMEYAKKRCDEACDSGDSIADIRYWVGYVDAPGSHRKEGERP